MARKDTPTQVQDFHILPLHITTHPSFPKETTHNLYLRANAPKIPTDDTPRELFLVNVPVDATQSHLRALFAEQLGGGRVEDVEFEGSRVGRGIKAPSIRQDGRSKKRKRGSEGAVMAGADETGDEVGLLPETWDRHLHRSGGTAVVRFVDATSAELSLRAIRHAAKTSKRITWPSDDEVGAPPLGSARYKRHHELRYPDHAELQASVDAYMSAFSAAEAKRERERVRSRSVPDDDGFVTVTRGGRNAPAAVGEVGVEKAEDVEVERKKRKKEKKRVGEDFYRFQLRERRKAEARGLVEGFEEDRRRVDEMRERKRRKVKDA